MSVAHGLQRIDRGAGLLPDPAVAARTSAQPTSGGARCRRRRRRRSAGSRGRGRTLGDDRQARPGRNRSATDFVRIESLDPCRSTCQPRSTRTLTTRTPGSSSRVLVKPRSARFPNTLKRLPLPSSVVSSADFPSMLTERSTLLNECRTSRFKCAGRGASGVTAGACGTAAGGGTGVDRATAASGGAAGLRGSAAHQGPMMRAVRATALVTCATSGIRNRTGSHGGHRNGSNREESGADTFGSISAAMGGIVYQ